MPTITAYIGVSHFCALLYKSKNDFDIFYSPYVYVDVFANYTDPGDFYLSILELFCKKNGVSISNCDIYVSGFLSIPDFKVPNVKKIEFTKLFENMPKYYPVIVNDFAFATKFFMISSSSFGLLKNNPDLEDSFKMNKSVYPQITSTDLACQLNMDKELLTSVLEEKLKWDANTPVIFMDSRFYGEEDRPLDYIYMFSLINTPGIYDIYLDRGNIILLYNMLNMALNEQKIPLDLSHIEHVGTLVVGSDVTEILISSDENPSVVFQVDANSLKRSPLDEDTEYRIVVKNKELGTVEKNIFGGKLGIIVDSRENNADAFSNMRKFETYHRFLKD